MRNFWPRLLFVLLSTVAQPSWCTAQLLLPGATGGQPSGGAASAAGSGAAVPAAKAKPVILRPPSEVSLVGRDLYRDGSAGGMSFARGSGKDKDKDLTITRLQLKGELISKPGEQCQVDVAAATPIATRFVGKPAGLSRYAAMIEACPFSFDVLDGAVLVVDAGQPDGPKTCDWKAADCRVDPTGLWGPAGNGFSAERTRELERARIHAETTMRANFHALLAGAGKDKAAVKAAAREQAGFSSNREMICRDYLREANHGFCALQLTEARSFALLARIGAETEGKPKPRPKPKKKPPAAAAALPENP